MVLAIDQGTQSSRVFLYSRDQRPIAFFQKELPQARGRAWEPAEIFPAWGLESPACSDADPSLIPVLSEAALSDAPFASLNAQHYPRAGWCEHDPMEILSSVHDCIGGALEAARQQLGGDSPRVAAVGITNQRETTVVWDRVTGRPLHRAIVWLDSRTATICEEMVRDLGTRDHFRSITGLPISTYFSGFKLRWLVDNVPEASDPPAAAPPLGTRGLIPSPPGPTDSRGHRRGPGPVRHSGQLAGLEPDRGRQRWCTRHR